MGIANTIKLSMLFAVLIALFGGIGYFFLGTSGLILGLLFAGGMNIITYLYSHKIVTRMYNAQPLDETQGRELHRMTEKLAEKAGVPKPDLYLMNSQTPNAFATGRNPEHGIVCVTTGLLHHLDTDEVEGVIAHEIGHIKNRDTFIQAVAGTIAGAISIIAQMLFFSSLDGEARNPVFMIGGILLAPLAASLIQMAISRSREFTADATAAQMTAPVNLANALRRIESAVEQAPMKDGARGTAHMFIINPFRGDTFAKLFSTHPPTEDRIRKLGQLE